MGVDVDKYFGYVMDVSEQVSDMKKNDLDDLFYDKYLARDESLSKELTDIGFVPHYNHPDKPTANNIELVDDGSNNEE